MKIILLILLLFALATTAIGLSYLHKATQAEKWFYAAQNEVEKIAGARNEDMALQTAVGNARSADKDRVVTQTIGRFFMWITLGAIGLSLVPAILILKRKN